MPLSKGMAIFLPAQEHIRTPQYREEEAAVSFMDGGYRRGTDLRRPALLGWYIKQ